MRRREFIALSGIAACWPFVTSAQQATPVIGYLGSESPDLFASRLRAFHQGLRTTGYEDGRNVTIDYRWAEGRNQLLPQMAAELVHNKVNVIAAPGSIASALAAKAATSTIPIVFETGADPVATRLVETLNRPGGNATGVTSLNAEVSAKRLELLHELMPSAKAFAFMVNPTNPRNAEATTQIIETAARARGLRIHALPANVVADFNTVFATAAQLRVGGVVIANETYFALRSDQLAEVAVRHRMPAIHQSREFAVAGGLMGYGGSTSESHHQAGVYTGRILKGEKPANLPVQQVTKIEFVINLRTARALGLHPSSSFIARADEVIE
jgi:putative ABC transport system substrate-binding protein